MSYSRRSIHFPRKRIIPVLISSVYDGEVRLYNCVLLPPRRRGNLAGFIASPAESSARSAANATVGEVVGKTSGVGSARRDRCRPPGGRSPVGKGPFDSTGLLVVKLVKACENFWTFLNNNAKFNLNLKNSVFAFIAVGNVDELF